MKYISFIAVLALTNVSCMSTVLDLCYPGCVRAGKMKSKTHHFIPDKADLISKLNHVPKIHSKYRRVYLKMKNKRGKMVWVSSLVQDAKENFKLKMLVRKVLVEAINKYEPDGEYLSLTKFIFSCLRKELRKKKFKVMGMKVKQSKKAITLVAAYELVRDLKPTYELLENIEELSRFRVFMDERKMFQPVVVIEQCGDTQVAKVIAIEYKPYYGSATLEGLSSEKKGLEHRQTKKATKALMRAFYPGRTITFRQKVIIYFNSTSSYISEWKIKQINTPGYKTCVISWRRGIQCQ